MASRSFVNAGAVDAAATPAAANGEVFGPAPPGTARPFQLFRGPDAGVPGIDLMRALQQAMHPATPPMGSTPLLRDQLSGA